MRKAALLIGTVVLLAGCGVRAPLQPEPGESLPVAPETAARQPTSEELLARPPIAAPARVDELLTRSEEREEDRFDLPPQ
jgi:predicted small lipoprotein YifL